MYQIDVGLGWTTLKSRLENLYNEPDIWSKIKHHRIVLNQVILTYYYQNAEDEGLLDEFQQYYSAISNVDTFTKIIEDNSGSSIGQVFERYFRKLYYLDYAISFEGEEIAASGALRKNLINSQNLEINTINPLLLFSTPGHHNTKSEENGQRYLAWLERLLKGEKEISIIDPYILSGTTPTETLCQYFLPLMQHCQVVNLFCNEDRVEQHCIDIAKKAAQDLGIQELHIYLCRGTHPRYIVTSELEINFDYGLDFLRTIEGRVTVHQGGAISWQRKRSQKKVDCKYGYLEREIELMAGKVIGKLS